MIHSLPEAGSRQAALPRLLPFDQLYAVHVASVHRFCLSQIGDTSAAEDITHDTFVRAYAAYARVRPDSASVRTWLFSIARNLSIDHHRSHRTWRLSLERQRRHASPQRDVESVAEERSRLREVSAAMSGLRRRDRELIGLRVAADLSYREVGELVGLSEPAAKIATYRALQRLRALLGPAPNQMTHEETTP